MNYLVHTLMYGYYFLALRNMIPLWFNPKIITNLQILQMFIGIIVTSSAYYYHYIDTSLNVENNLIPCKLNETNLNIGLGIYLSYLILFIYFSLNKYKTNKTT